MADKFYSVAKGEQLAHQVTEGSSTSGEAIELRVSDSMYGSKQDVLNGLGAIRDYLTDRIIHVEDEEEELVLPLDLVTGWTVAYGTIALAAEWVGEDFYAERTSGMDTFIPAWGDQSGNGHDVIQETEGRQPKLIAGVFGSAPGILFTKASDTFLASSDDLTLSAGAYTLFVVMKATAELDAAGVFGIDAAQDPDGECLSFSVGGSFQTLAAFATSDDFDEAYVDITSEGFDGPDGAVAIYEVAFTHGSYSMMTNGTNRPVNEASFVDGGAVGPIVGKCAVGTSDADPILAFSDLFDGHIAAVLFKNAIIPDEDRTAVRESLADLFGVTL